MRSSQPSPAACSPSATGPLSQSGAAAPHDRRWPRRRPRECPAARGDRVRRLRRRGRRGADDRARGRPDPRVALHPSGHGRRARRAHSGGCRDRARSCPGPTGTAPADRVGLAALSAVAAVVVVAAVGVAVHAPLSRVPENGMKFAVGVMLTSFGVFWGAEGAGASWPGNDVALLVIVPLTALVALAYVGLL